MPPDPDWLPSLVSLNNYHGNYDSHFNAVYGIFRNGFLTSQPKFQNCWVRTQRHPIVNGKEEGFWHCIEGGASNAVPDLSRMERISWIRAIIENSTDETVSCWNVEKGNSFRWKLWFREEFLVILDEKVRKSDGFKTFLLVTAYTTNRNHTIRKLRKERIEHL